MARYALSLLFIALCAWETIVAGSLTKCDPSQCSLRDNCLCPSTRPPANLSASSMPQFVMLTFDDAVNEENMDFYRQLLGPGRRRNRANGCNLAATFFVSAGYTDYSLVHELHSVGNEIAIHSITHRYNLSYWRTLDVAGWAAEFVGDRDLLRDYALIPERDMVGARAPFLEAGNGEAYDMMQKSGFVYDSSVCIESNFERYYHTNRAPFPVFTHDFWLQSPGRRQGYLSFVDWLLTMDDVFVVTVAEVVRFMRDPKPLDEYVQTSCSRASEFRRCPQVHSCSFPDAPIKETRRLIGCKPCPESYPWLRDVVRKAKDDARVARKQYFDAGCVLLLCSAFVVCLYVAAKRFGRRKKRFF
ncbi:uncharacterized protein LOC119431388 isoform X10 [Dermacentor silvarum]|uniref:uncharacterized protein LOC119431388 isoform X10 n=1 Tax=Dermacentor silvarum TaxID=543639 RepID=UPI0021016600|nr:uncharacterized protein LOC119431388 isoform X10 [Dermacentor silvarum]